MYLLVGRQLTFGQLEDVHDNAFNNGGEDGAAERVLAVLVHLPPVHHSLLPVATQLLCHEGLSAKSKYEAVHIVGCIYMMTLDCW
jgi:hypothetical protein